MAAFAPFNTKQQPFDPELFASGGMIAALQAAGLAPGPETLRYHEMETKLDRRIEPHIYDAVLSRRSYEEPTEELNAALKRHLQKINPRKRRLAGDGDGTGAVGKADAPERPTIPNARNNRERTPLPRSAAPRSSARRRTSTTPDVRTDAAERRPSPVRPMEAEARTPTPGLEERVRLTEAPRVRDAASSSGHRAGRDGGEEPGPPLRDAAPSPAVRLTPSIARQQGRARSTTMRRFSPAPRAQSVTLASARRASSARQRKVSLTEASESGQHHPQGTDEPTRADVSVPPWRRADAQLSASSGRPATPAAESRRNTPAGSEQPVAIGPHPARHGQQQPPWSQSATGDVDWSEEVANRPWRQEERAHSGSKGKGRVREPEGPGRQLPREPEGPGRQLPNVHHVLHPRPDSYELVDSSSNDPPPRERGHGPGRDPRPQSRGHSSDKGGGKRRRGDEPDESGSRRPVNRRCQEVMRFEPVE